MNKICARLPCSREDESQNNNGYESAASFSLGHIPNGGATKHLLQRRVSLKIVFFCEIFDKKETWFFRLLKRHSRLAANVQL